MKASSALVGILTVVAACRIERVRTADTATAAAAEPGAGLNSCGITSESRVRDDGIGVLRVGASLDAVRANCTVISERTGANDAPMVAQVDLGRDTAVVEFLNGALSRITLHHQAYRTSDSLGVGTHITRLLALRGATGLTERGRLYAITPAYCGLRFMLMSPAPTPPSPQSGRAALRRLEGETRVRELEIAPCPRRR